MHVCFASWTATRHSRPWLLNWKRFACPTNPMNQGFRTPNGQCDQSTLRFDNLRFGSETGVLPFDAVNNNAFLSAEFFTNAASSVYHALQANITRRFAKGLAFQAAYTWAHAIDNSSDPLVPTAGNQEFPRNSFDLAAERGNSDFDVRQRLVINYSWDLPIGRGRAHLAEGLAGRIFEGWQLAGITTFSGGLPYDIFTVTDTLPTPASGSAWTSTQRVFRLPSATPLLRLGRTWDCRVLRSSPTLHSAVEGTRAATTFVVRESTIGM